MPGNARMLTTMLQRGLRHFAFEYGVLRNPYVRFCHPSGREYADYLRKWGGLQAMGDDCEINHGVVFTDPAYVSIGNNVVLADCTLIGHDGSIAMLNRAYGVKLDAVGKIVIHDDVFIGHGVIVLPGVSIGPNAIVAAGAVVSRDVAEGDIAGGVPARPISRVADRVRHLQQETEHLPWADVIRNRDGAFDAALEPELLRQRVLHFFPRH